MLAAIVVFAIALAVAAAHLLAYFLVVFAITLVALAFFAITLAALAVFAVALAALASPALAAAVVMVARLLAFGSGPVQQFLRRADTTLQESTFSGAAMVVAEVFTSVAFSVPLELLAFTVVAHT